MDEEPASQDLEQRVAALEETVKAMLAMDPAFVEGISVALHNRLQWMIARDGRPL
jgi:hypothetical protein